MVRPYGAKPRRFIQSSSVASGTLSIRLAAATTPSTVLELLYGRQHGAVSRHGPESRHGSPKALTIQQRPPASNKILMTEQMRLSSTGTLSGIINGDTVTLNGTGTFASHQCRHRYCLTSTLGGAQASNYTLTQPTGLTANITG